MRKTLLLLLLAVTGAAACASVGTTDVNRTPSDLLLRIDIEDSPQSNAYDLVRYLRPRWLQIRGLNSINNNQPLTIYIDGVRLGGPTSLASIPTTSVEKMEFLRPPEAQTRFGLNNTQGAIAVTTRTR